MESIEYWRWCREDMWDEGRNCWAMDESIRERGGTFSYVAAYRRLFGREALRPRQIRSAESGRSA